MSEENFRELMREHGETLARLSLALEQLDKAAVEIERLKGVIKSYEQDRLFEAGKGKIGSL